MIVQLSRAHYPVTVLGHGRRVGLWFQGCSIGCEGCIATDTWAPDPAREIDVGHLVDWCQSLPPGVDGVTISGGEPFDQPEALGELLRRLRPWADKGGRDLLCYSGRSLAVLRARHQPVLDLLDVVIPGPYLAQAAPGAVWRGSANQELLPLTALGHARYAADVDRPMDRARLQVTVDDGVVWYIGVPRPGDLDALDAALARRGLVQGGEIMADLICPSCGALGTGDTPLCGTCIRPFVPRQPDGPPAAGPVDAGPAPAAAGTAAAFDATALDTTARNATPLDARTLDATSRDATSRETGGPGAARPAAHPRPVGGDAVRDCGDQDCEHDGVLPADGCRACGRAGSGPGSAPGATRATEAAKPARLRFPWGEESVPAEGRLPIGREGSPLAPRIAAYTNVGRRHAEITVVGGGLCVVDLESVNGTFVNDERIPSLRPRTLADGDELRFAAGLRATVILTRAT